MLTAAAVTDGTVCKCDTLGKCGRRTLDAMSAKPSPGRAARLVLAVNLHVPSACSKMKVCTLQQTWKSLGLQPERFCHCRLGSFEAMTPIVKNKR